jgi:putative ABC transport system permease protein
MILNRRILREFREHFIRWGALFLLITVGMMMAVSLCGAATSVIKTTGDHAIKSRLEHGQFSVLTELSPEMLDDLTDEGYEVEKSFYRDYATVNDATLRVFSNRKDINLPAVASGWLPVNSDEIFLEKHFADILNCKLGSKIQAGGEKWTVVGIGTLPDYEALLKSFGDIGSNPEKFSVCLVSTSGYEKLNERNEADSAEVLLYSFRLPADGTMKELNTYLKDHVGENNRLISFTPAADNSRIDAAGQDIMITGIGGLVGAVIFLVLFGYVISVFLSQTLDRESSVIGALYALGVSRREFLLHYLQLPAWLGFLGSVAGTGIGWLIIPMQFTESIAYYSYPEPVVSVPWQLIVLSILMPPFICVAVNYLFIRKRLNATPLSLLRGQKTERVSGRASFNRFSFSSRFQIRHFLREKKSAAALTGALFLTLLLVMLAVNCYFVIDNLAVQNKEDVRFSYLYLLKYMPERVPEKSSIAYAESLNREDKGYDVSVTLLGIESKNPYFPFTIPQKDDEVVLSSSVALKFGLQEGDSFSLFDRIEEKEYKFRVSSVEQYSAGTYVFLNIDSMRELFDQKDDFYNILISKDKLDIPGEQIANTIEREDILGFADLFQKMMTGLIVMLSLASNFILFLVLYLMLKNMVDRASYSITLTKTFGYSDKEVQKLYLGTGFWIVLISSIVSIPLSKICVNQMFPYLVFNVGSGFDLSFHPAVYLAILCWIMANFGIIYALLIHRLKYIPASAVLKNRE